MRDTVRKLLVPTGILPTLACVALAVGLSFAHDHGGGGGSHEGGNSGTPGGGAPLRTWQEIEWQHEHWSDIQRVIAQGGPVADRIIASGASSLAWGYAAPRQQRVARVAAPAPRRVAAPAPSPDQKAPPPAGNTVPPIPGRQGSLAFRPIGPLNLLAFR